jgi:hypothetical protein
MMSSADSASKEGTATLNVPVNRPWNMLLYWMSDTGEGSWDRFRNVVAELAKSDRDLSQLRRSLRVRLSDFGYANFFVGESSRWQTLPPRLAGLMEPIDAALLVGARTPNLLREIAAAARQHGVAIECEASDDSPDLIRMTGPPDALKACTVAVGIEYADNYARRLVAALSPIPLLLNRPRRDTDCAPINWVVRSFDLQSREWVDGAMPNTACEFTPRYGRPRYFVSNRRRRLLEIPGRRDAVYAAASMRGVPLTAYDTATMSFSVPLSAPLPEAYARAACLCSGRRAEVRDGRIVYSGVQPEIGAVLSTALGQPRAMPPVQDRTQER